METKKNPKIDLEKQRKTFFTFGLVLSLLAVLVAFKTANEVEEIEIPTTGTSVNLVDIIIPITRPEVEPKPVIPEFKLFDEIKIVDNTSDIPEPNLIFEDPDAPMPDPIIIKEEEPTQEIVFFPQQWPEFPGGAKSLNQYLSRNIKYPIQAQELNISGRVYLNFVVGTDGSITDVKITKGVDKLLDQEAIRVISSMPNWKPGLQNGKAVKVSYNVFVTFQLN